MVETSKVQVLDAVGFLEQDQIARIDIKTEVVVPLAGGGLAADVGIIQVMMET